MRLYGFQSWKNHFITVAGSGFLAATVPARLCIGNWLKRDRTLSSLVLVGEEQMHVERKPPIMATVLLWLAVVVAMGYWRLFYAWRFGNGLIFFTQFFPRLVLALIAVLVLEYFYFRHKE
jgi:hypothetical protein